MNNDTWTAADVPGQTGRVAVVTGGNRGLGYEVAALLARHGVSVVLAVRDAERGRMAAASIARAVPGADVVVQPVDLARQDSVRRAAAAIRSRYDRIDLLINNAGVMYTPRQTTVDGFELQLATNYLGHFTLTGLLLDRLLATPGSRVVNVSSLGHRIRARIDFNDLQSVGTYDRIAAYGRSKLALLMFTYELARRLSTTDTTIAVAAHPGSANTGLFYNSPLPIRIALAAMSPLFQTPRMGALPLLRAATGHGVANGEFYGPRLMGFRGYPVLARSSHESHDVELQSRLWKISERLTRVSYPV
jgi:NAD(P)-dependent dehydrogenase (short-subunit alcohol dehydrogenase family)